MEPAKRKLSSCPRKSRMPPITPLTMSMDVSFLVSVIGSL
jgi:hypothetical protein